MLPVPLHNEVVDVDGLAAMDVGRNYGILAQETNRAHAHSVDASPIDFAALNGGGKVRPGVAESSGQILSDAALRQPLGDCFEQVDVWADPLAALAFQRTGCIR